MLRQLELVINGAFGITVQLQLTRAPELPKARSRRLFASDEAPVAKQHHLFPATDGRSIWLPVSADDAEVIKDFENVRIMALQQAARAHRGSMTTMLQAADPLVRAIYEVLEADAADIDLVTRFRGLTGPLNGFRRQALGQRPSPTELAPERRPLEQWVHEILEIPCEAAAQAREHAATRSLQLAAELAPELLKGMPEVTRELAGLLHRDLWIGELRLEAVSAAARALPKAEAPAALDIKLPAPEAAIIEAAFDETQLLGESSSDVPVEVELPGPPWFDPALLTDEGVDASIEATQPMVVGAMELRPLTTLSGSSPEATLADIDLPLPNGLSDAPSAQCSLLSYPEWDYRTGAYNEAGATLALLPAQQGAEEWVDTTLDQHHGLARGIRQRFEALRAHRRQADEIDIDADSDTCGDLRAGLPQRNGAHAARLNVATLLLIEVGTSSQEWISSTHQLLDLQREALLLACLGLYSLGEPYSVFAVASDGSQRPSMRCIKQFDEPYGDEVARRIAGLTSEPHTRTGAALRHATSLLAQQSAQHRMLLLLSDGAPNSAAEYQGRYGTEDMRQAVRDARLQGISSLCFTTDQLNGNYLPAVFGEQQSTVLYRPELLPSAFTQWLHRLMRF